MCHDFIVSVIQTTQGVINHTQCIVVGSCAYSELPSMLALSACCSAVSSSSTSCRLSASALCRYWSSPSSSLPPSPPFCWSWPSRVMSEGLIGCTAGMMRSSWSASVSANSPTTTNNEYPGMTETKYLQPFFFFFLLFFQLLCYLTDRYKMILKASQGHQTTWSVLWLYILKKRRKKVWTLCWSK